MKLTLPRPVGASATTQHMTLEFTTSENSGTVDVWLVTSSGSRVTWWQLDTDQAIKLSSLLLKGASL